MVCPPPGTMSSRALGWRAISSRWKLWASRSPSTSLLPTPSQNCGIDSLTGSAAMRSRGVFSFSACLSWPNGLTSRGGLPSWSLLGVK